MHDLELFSHWTFGAFAPGSIPRSKYNAFREIHAEAAACFDLLARIEDFAMGRRLVDWCQVSALTSDLASRIRLLADHLQIMNPVRFMDVHDWVAKVGFYARLATALDVLPSTPPYCVPVHPGRSVDMQAWPVLNRIQVSGPDVPGLLLTPSLFQYFVEANDLRPGLDAVLQTLDAGAPEEIERSSRHLRSLVLAGVLPEVLRSELEIAALDVFPDQGGLDLWIMVGTGDEALCLGQIGVARPSDLGWAWIEAAAMKYHRDAIMLRLGAGLADDEHALAILVLPAGSAAATRPERVYSDPTAFLRRLESIQSHVTRLHVFQAEGAALVAEQCRSLHDLVCLCLERGLAQIFSFAGRPALGLASIKHLRLEIPVAFHVFNLGGGLFPTAVEKTVVGMEDVRSAPAWSLLLGLTSPLVRWPGSGHESVEDAAAHHSSYAVMSQVYLYCTLRLERNLYVIECDSDDDGGKGYIGYWFKGGSGSEAQRALRLAVMRMVLEGEGFVVSLRGDYLHATRNGVEDVFLQRNLVCLGLLLAWVQARDHAAEMLNLEQSVRNFKGLLAQFMASPL